MTAAELVLQLSQGCSLHLAQRLSQLLSLQLRRMPILSKESAPGLIIATGELTLPVVTDGFSCWLTCSRIHRDPRHLGQPWLCGREMSWLLEDSAVLVGPGDKLTYS